jgi:hypothetical protein
MVSIMYPHWRSLLPHWTPTQKWMIGAFSFGFLRGMGATYSTFDDLIVHRVILSSYNGAMYLIPPFTIYRALNLLVRAEIYLTKKDPTLYSYVYEEWCGGKNRRVFF